MVQLRGRVGGIDHGSEGIVIGEPEDVPLSPSLLRDRLPRRLNLLTPTSSHSDREEGGELPSPLPTSGGDMEQNDSMAQRKGEPLPGALLAVFVLTSINFINYLDRYVPSAAKQKIQSEFMLDDSQTSLQLTGFIVVYMFSSPFFGFLADSGRFSRLRLIAFSIVFWSATTIFTAFTKSFAGFLICRSLVGFGEAGYATITPGVLGDYYPVERRNLILTIFQAAAPIGAASGFVMGGALSDSIGWRNTFIVSGIPGLVLCVLLLFIRDPPRGLHDDVLLRGPKDVQEEESESSSSGDDNHNKTTDVASLVKKRKRRTSLPSVASPHSHSSSSHSFATSCSLLKETAVALSRNHVYVFCCLGQVLVTWAIGGLADWLPTYFERRFNVSPTQSGISTGGATVAGGLFGTFCGCWVADKLVGKTRLPYMLASGLGLIPGTILAFAAITVTESMVLCSILVALAQFFVWWYNGPITALIINCTHPELRSRAFSVSILSLHLFGDAISPYTIGWVSTRADSLQAGILLAPCFLGAGCIVWLIGWKILPEPPVNQERIITAMDGEPGETLETYGGRLFTRMSDDDEVRSPSASPSTAVFSGRGGYDLEERGGEALGLVGRGGRERDRSRDRRRGEKEGVQADDIQYGERNRTWEGTGEGVEEDRLDISASGDGVYPIYQPHQLYGYPRNPATEQEGGSGSGQYETIEGEGERGGGGEEEGVGGAKKEEEGDDSFRISFTVDPFSTRSLTDSFGSGEDSLRTNELWMVGESASTGGTTGGTQTQFQEGGGGER